MSFTIKNTLTEIPQVLLTDILKLSVTNSSVTLAPTKDSFIIISEVNVSSSGNIINVNVDSSKCSLGTNLTFFFKFVNNVDNNILLTFPSNFYITKCGGPSNVFNLGIERFVISFIFDGEKFVNTQDTC